MELRSSKIINPQQDVNKMENPGPSTEGSAECRKMQFGEAQEEFYDARNEFSCVAMSRIPLPKMPPFNRDDVEEWFRRLTVQLRLIGAKTENDKFRGLLCYLDDRLIIQVEDDIEADEKEPYTKAKDRLLAMFAISKKQLLEKMMRLSANEKELPSVFLRTLLRVGGEENASLARDIWEDSLPDHITAVIHSMSDSSIAEVSAAADAIFKATQRKTAPKTATPVVETTAASPSPVFATQQAVLERLNQLEVLIVKSSKPPPEKKPSGLMKRPSIPRPSNVPVEMQCFFHKRFGDAARICQCPKN